MKYKQIVVMLFLVAMFGLFGIGIYRSVMAASPNYGWSKEHYQLKFQGYVQAQGAYYDRVRGGHARRGYMKFTNTQDDSEYHTDHTMGEDDIKICPKEIWVWDLLNPLAPQARFEWWHSYNPHGAPWPEALPEVDK